MATAATLNAVGGYTLPRVRFAKPRKSQVETIATREILRWSLQWPHDVAEGDRPSYAAVAGRWKVRIS